MREQKTTSERLATFSDAVFAVIITIMVLDLKPPTEATLGALLPLWPTFLSYAVSYLFIAIIWINHHHLFEYARKATPELIWWNFAHLFMISLVPATTAWMASTRLAATPVFVYALCLSWWRSPTWLSNAWRFPRQETAKSLLRPGGSREFAPISHSACLVWPQPSLSGLP